MLPFVTLCYHVLLPVTMCYPVLLCVTLCSPVTPCYPVLPCVSQCLPLFCSVTLCCSLSRCPFVSLSFFLPPVSARVLFHVHVFFVPFVLLCLLFLLVSPVFPCVPLYPFVSPCVPCVPCFPLCPPVPLCLLAFHFVPCVPFVLPCSLCPLCLLCPLFPLKCMVAFPFFLILHENFDGFHCFHMTSYGFFSCSRFLPVSPCIPLCPPLSLVSRVSFCVHWCSLCLLCLFVSPCVSCVLLCSLWCLGPPVSLGPSVSLVSPEIYGGVALVFLIVCKLWWVSFLSYYILRGFFLHTQEVKGCDSSWKEKFKTKFCLTCLENNLCLLACLSFITLENLWLNSDVVSRAMFARVLKELRNNYVNLGTIFPS